MRSGRAAALLAASLFIAGCARARPAQPAEPARAPDRAQPEQDQPGAPPQPNPAPSPSHLLPDPVRQLHADIDALLEQPGHQRGVWGVAVRSLARADRLYERSPHTLLVPASAMKLVTTAVAAQSVGWDYVFETTLSATGPVVRTTLEGDLVITGTGDPTILGRAGDDVLALWIDALRARGITRINGRVIGDDDLVEEPAPGYAWSWEDLGFAYGSMPGALNLAENLVSVRVTPAAVEGLPAIVELPPEARGLPLMNRITTSAAGTGENTWPELRPGDATLSVNGTIAVGAEPSAVSMAVGNPTDWFARRLRNQILEAGIDVTGPAVDIDQLDAKPDRASATAIHVYRSRPLSEIAKPIVKDSINLYAEAVLRLATGPDGARTTALGLDVVRARLESWGIPKDGIQIVDGSGLSRRDVVAPETLVSILTRLYDASGASPWMQAMAIAGRDGSLENRLKGTVAEGNAIGKTGSMSNVRTLAGYVKTADGEPLAFAIMANNFEGTPAQVLATIDRLVVRLATFSRSAATATKATKIF
jgi:D-alanyl-D-alanine carboxypeptidase/D-alanyl-D-alanine-endopeptidase (penicillin-binding protein 4)